MFKFKPVITDDGTFSLYNNEVNDVYHSRIGAYTEALNKFVLPSGIIEFVRKNNSIRILDICFGLGYNSKVAITEILKINPDCNINITAIEMDKNIIFLSPLATFQKLNLDLNFIFYKLVSSHFEYIDFINKISKDENFKYIINEYPKIHGYLESSSKKKAHLLHNIYYRTISSRNKIIEKLCYDDNLLNVELYISDARNVIPVINKKFDFVFHDPFTPYKLPTLWTVEVFKLIYNLMDNNAKLLTYSSSATARAGMIEAGFFIGETEPVGRKACGTVAVKNNNLITRSINSYDKGLLNTNAGIPYYDPNLLFTTDEIHKYRKDIQTQSSRKSTSSYIKRK